MFKRKIPNELTLEKKVELIKFVTGGNSERKAAEQFNVGKGTVSAIKKRKDEYLRWYEEENIEANRNRKIRKTENDSINELTWAWFQRMRAMNLPISGPMIQLVAKEFADKFSKLEFKASNGLMSFRKAHNIEQRAICGESSEVNINVVNYFVERLPHICEGYSSSDIFNADETGLFFRALPDKSLTVKGKGGKFPKERLSILLAASATGEKLKPLVIGKAAKPRCLNGVKIDDLPVIWLANKKAWMVSEIFSEWVLNLNKSFRSQKRNVLLFTDNCPAHPDVKLSNIKLKFLPPNITSVCQPLDQGVIRAFKSLYRKELLRAIIGRLETSGTTSEVIKSITILDAVYWIDKAWKLIKANNIVKCFNNAGFPVVEVREDDALDDNIPLQQLFYPS